MSVKTNSINAHVFFIIMLLEVKDVVLLVYLNSAVGVVALATSTAPVIVTALGRPNLACKINSES